MKLSRKFTVYTVVIATLLAVTGVIAAVYGTSSSVVYCEVPGAPAGNLGAAAVIIKRVVSDPAELANHLFYILTIIGFGITLLVVLKLRRKLLEPLLSAVKFSLALADNQFPPKLKSPDEKNDEINELISSLNFMRDRLQSTFIKLQASHENEKNARLSSELLTQMRTGYIQHIVPDVFECLDVLSNNVEIIRRDLKPSPKDREATLLGMRKSLGMLDRHFNRLMELSKIGIGKERSAPEKLKCFDFIEFVVKYSAELFEPRGIRIETEYNSGMPSTIVADPEILRMLLTMAIHAVADNAEPGEVVCCGCFSEGERVVFEIRDSKHFDAQDHVKKLFDDFISTAADISQADRRLTNLLVLREWAQSFDGTVELASGGENFNLRLRLFFNEWELSGNALPAATFSRRLSSKSVSKSVDELFEPVPAKLLIAESNRELAATARILLEADRHSVKIVSNAAELLEAASAEHYDGIAISLHISDAAIRRTIEAIRSGESPNRRTLLAVVSSSPFLTRDDFTPEEVKYFINRPVDFQMLRQIAGRCRVAAD